MHKLLLTLLAALMPVAAQAAPPSVSEEFGNIIFHDGQGVSRPLTSDHHSGKPVLSPDGRTLAWIHVDRKAGDDPNEAGQTSVWIADALTGGGRKLAGSTHDADLRAEIVNPEAVAFSLDGGHLYVTSQLGATSPGIHQIKLGLGTHKFVTGGALNGVIRNGPYRGFLLVGEHRYYPQGGSYDATFLVRPDGQHMLMIPGSDSDKPGVDPVNRWLNAHQWTAS